MKPWGEFHSRRSKVGLMNWNSLPILFIVFHWTERLLLVLGVPPIYLCCNPLVFYIFCIM